MNDKRFPTLVTACLLFFANGFMTAALGPLLPELSRRVDASLPAVGGVVTGIFLGALAAQVLSGPLMDRLGPRRILLAGTVCLGVGTAGIAFSPSLELLLLSAVLSGLGHGSVDLGVCVTLAGLYRRRSVSVLNLVNLFYGAGAFAGPAVVSGLLAGGVPGMPALGWCAGVTLAAIPLVAWTAPSRLAPAHTEPRADARLYRSPRLWAMGSLLLLYVGLENGVGAWTAAYLQAAGGVTASQAALVTAGFWLALTAGRLLGAGLGARFSPEGVLWASLSGSLLGGLLLVGARGAAGLSTAAVILAGLSFGAIYPTTIALVTARFHHAPGKATGVAASMGSLGGTTLPWVEGQLLARFGPPGAAGFTAAVAGAMLGLFAVLQARAEHPTPDKRMITTEFTE